MIMNKGIKLYHGSYTVVEKPDLSLCEAGKDFGRGFYLTTDLHQAERFVKTSVGKAIKNNKLGANSSYGYINEYIYNLDDDLNIFEFKSADSDWLHCVASHRKHGLLIEELDKWNKYDVIVGKIANDNTNRVLTAYIDGEYGLVGSDSADKFTIGLLLPEKLTNQICLKTEDSLKCLKFVKATQYRI